MGIIKFYILLWGFKFINLIYSKIRKNAGSTIIGKLASILQKDFVTYFKNIDYNKVFFITGTNGKTSTTNLIAHTIKETGKKVATNSAGANMIGGIATTLIKNSTLSGKFNKEYLILEVDESSIEAMHKKIPANNLVVTNILKDQVQRNGDPDYIYRRIKRIITPEMRLFLNNEEPRSKSLEEYSKNVIYYSVERHEESFVRHDFYNVTLSCPKCYNKIDFNYYNLESIGEFKCSSCNYSSNKNVNLKITEVNHKNKTFKCDGIRYQVNYTLPFYLYNYAICLAIAKVLELDEEKVVEALRTFENPFERREVIYYKTKEIKYLRMKQENPETLQNALNTIAKDKSEKAILIGLFEIKDFKPAYANTFYFFDCDFNEIAKTEVEKYISFSQTVAYDCANRIIYAGVPKSKIEIIDSDDVEETLKRIDEIRTRNIYLVTGMKPYRKIKKYFAKK